MQLKPGKYKNRVVARGASHLINDINRTLSNNEKIKRETYQKYDDDMFYSIFKPIEDRGTKIKNKYVIQRLREIERKKGILSSSNLGCMTSLLMICIMAVIIVLILSLII